MGARTVWAGSGDLGLSLAQSKVLTWYRTCSLSGRSTAVPIGIKSSEIGLPDWQIIDATAELAEFGLLDASGVEITVKAIR